MSTEIGADAQELSTGQIPGTEDSKRAPFLVTLEEDPADWLLRYQIFSGDGRRDYLAGFATPEARSRYLGFLGAEVVSTEVWPCT